MTFTLELKRLTKSGRRGFTVRLNTTAQTDKVSVATAPQKIVPVSLKALRVPFFVSAVELRIRVHFLDP